MIARDLHRNYELVLTYEEAELLWAAMNYILLHTKPAPLNQSTNLVDLIIKIEASLDEYVNT